MVGVGLIAPTLFTAPPASAGRHPTVKVFDNYFKPTEVTVDKGESVRFKSRARRTHNVTLRYNGNVQSSDVSRGGEASFSVSDRGTFTFFDKKYKDRGMKGKLIVR